MTRVVLIAIGLSILTAKAEIPANIRVLVDNIRTAARGESPAGRAETLLQISTILRFHFPDEAKRLALQSESSLSADDDYPRSKIYRVVLDIDAAEAAKIAARIRDKNIRYSAELQHCIENHDSRCGRDVLARGHDSGTYRISGTNWVINQLAATDPAAARAVFARVLQLFPANDAGFHDVQMLLDSAQAIASTDLELAKRAAKAVGTAVEKPAFEARTEEIVTARFQVDGRSIQTASTRETVLFQVHWLLDHGSLPRQVETQYTLKPLSRTVPQQMSRDPGIDRLLEKLKHEVQELNDFTLEDLNGRSYRLKELRGRPVLLDFWATWCAPCRREMPQVDALQRKGLTVLAISDEDEKVVRAFAAANRYAFAILRDPYGKVFQLYDVVPRPTIILIDSDGRIAGRWAGLPRAEVLSEALEHQRSK